MAPDPKPIAGNAPKWLIQAGIDGGWLDKSGKPTKDAKKEAPKPTSTGNGKGYSAAQGLKKMSYGLPASFGGLELSGVPSLKTKGEGIKLNGISTIGSEGANKLLARGGRFSGDYKPHGAPLMRASADLPRSGSHTSRAAGPKPKATVAYHKPDGTMKPGGVVLGDRTYKFGS